MSEHEDYADLDLPPPVLERLSMPVWELLGWLAVALLVVGGGFAYLCLHKE
jgi:hypothetical protein